MAEQNPGQLPHSAEREDFVTEMLNKTLTTGHGQTPETQQNAAALRREYLENDVKMLSYTSADFTIYPDLAKQPVNSTVVQYPIFNSHGRVGHSRFVREIGVAPVNDPKMRQVTVHMKFLSDTKQQSLASGMVNNVEDPMTINEDDAMTVIAKTIEWAIFHGDASLSADAGDTAGIEFNGLKKLIDQKTNVMDLRGEEFSENALNIATTKIAKGYGTPTDAYMPIGVLATYNNETQNNRQVIVQNYGDGSGATRAGNNVTEVNTVRGRITLHGSTIMENEQVLFEDFVPQINAPLPPQTVGVDVQANAGGRFRPDDIGTHNYKIKVWSDDAESKPSEAFEAVVSEATQAVELQIQLQNLNGAIPQYIEIYRQGFTTGEYYLIDRVPASQMVGNTITYVDKNDTIPETTDVFVGDMNPQTITLLELLPMLKQPLAQMNATTTFSVLWYGALALYAPKKWVHIKNVKYVPAIAAEYSLTHP